MILEVRMSQSIAEVRFEIIKGTEKSLSSLLSKKQVASENHFQGYFPKTRFYGSKLRLLNFISDALQPLSFDTVGDLFGGTGTVSLLFKYKDKKVTYNDILKSNCLMAEAVLSNSPVEAEPINDFYEEIGKKLGTISKFYEDIYFTNEENEWLDGAAHKLQQVQDNHLNASLHYCLFQACLQKRPFNLFHRKNLYIRQNCSKKTNFGNWATWERPFQELIGRSASELAKRNGLELGQANILSPSSASNVKPGFDLIYIDPPYLHQSSNSLNYMERYHFLEGFCDYSSWSDKIQMSRTNRPIKASDEMLRWNSKTHFKESLFELIDRHKNSITVMSYASDGYPDVNEIIKFFKQNFNSVVIHKNKLSHAMKREKKDEFLFIGF